MKRVLSAMAIAMLAAGGVALAQEGPKAMGDLTRADAKAKAIAIFDRLDLNHDGKLDQADRDLRIKMRFDRIDTDHNGQISLAEFTAAREHGPWHHGAGQSGAPGQSGSAGGPQMADGKPGPHGPHGPGHHWGPGRGWGPDGMGMLAMADTNHDGVITKDEFVTAALKRFDAADANHDGILTAPERQAARKAMQDEWRARNRQMHDQMHGPMHGHASGAMPPPPPPPPPPVS